MNLIDGKVIAAAIRAEVKREITERRLHPKLAVLLVGDDRASHVYVNLKEKTAAEVGIATDIRRVPASASDEKLEQIVKNWNADETVDAILIQLPLPAHHDTDAVIAAMDPLKDVDGFHPENLKALREGNAKLFPPVHESALRLIGATGKDMRGAKAVIIANSDTFAGPLERLLSKAGCFVTVMKPDELEPKIVGEADITVVAIGRPKFLKRDLVKSDAVIIDIGTTQLPDGRIVGDVDADNMKDIPGWLSPVPGGVGPMTVALLLKNVTELSKRRRGILKS